MNFIRPGTVIKELAKKKSEFYAHSAFSKMGYMGSSNIVWNKESLKSTYRSSKRNVGAGQATNSNARIFPFFLYWKISM